jgi:hypothetical protein
MKGGCGEIFTSRSVGGGRQRPTYSACNSVMGPAFAELQLRRYVSVSQGACFAAANDAPAAAALVRGIR